MTLQITIAQALMMESVKPPLLKTYITKKEIHIEHR